MKQQQDDDSLDFEKTVSIKLAEENRSKATVCNDEIDFKILIHLLNNYDDYFLNLKFSLVGDEKNKNPQKILNFTTLIHFLDTYLNNSYQKYFDTFRKDNK